MVWRTAETAALLVFELLRFLCRMLGFLAVAIGGALLPSRLYDRTEDFFLWLGGILRGEPFDSAGEITGRVLTQLTRTLNRSAHARRWFLAFAVVAAFYLLYPPSHWGPWRLHERGVASYYGSGFYFNKMANGDRLYPWTVVAAHRTLPLGTTVYVRNRENGRSAYLKIADRGPYVAGRILDLSAQAASRLGLKEKGLAEVDIYVRK